MFCHNIPYEDNLFFLFNMNKFTSLLFNVLISEYYSTEGKFEKDLSQIMKTTTDNIQMKYIFVIILINKYILIIVL